MILSHGHQFIVFKTRKTGGTSFEIALSKYAAAEDIVTPIAPDDERIRAALGFAGPRNFLLPAAAGQGEMTGARKFYNHIGAAEARPMLPAAVFDGYLKAAIIRNPFDYAVSWYFWERSRVTQTSRDDFRLWLRANFQQRERILAASRNPRDCRIRSQRSSARSVRRAVTAPHRPHRVRCSTALPRARR